MKNTAGKTQKRKNPSRRKTKAKTKTKAPAAEIKHLITKLYDGTADLIIKIPQTPKKTAKETTNKAPAETINEPTAEPAKELIELILPPAAKTADDSDRAAALASALISFLLKDIETAKQANRKVLQAEGIARAKAKGQRFGPESMTFDAELFEELCQAYRNNEISASEAGRQLGCNYKTFQRRYAQKYPEEKNED